MSNGLDRMRHSLTRHDVGSAQSGLPKIEPCCARFDLFYGLGWAVAARDDPCLDHV